jgi:hypothetical protein
LICTFFVNVIFLNVFSFQDEEDAEPEPDTADIASVDSEDDTCMVSFIFDYNRYFSQCFFFPG